MTFVKVAQFRGKRARSLVAVCLSDQFQRMDYLLFSTELDTPFKMQGQVEEDTSRKSKDVFSFFWRKDKLQITSLCGSYKI